VTIQAAGIQHPRALRRVLHIYNTDYDEELTAQSGADVSAVEEAARAVQAAAGDFGLATELLGVRGPDLAGVFERLKDDPPDLVFNLCESLSGDTRNEVVIPAILDLLRIPYTGPDPLVIGLCLHKDRTKEVLVARGIATPEHVVFRTRADLAQARDLRYPQFLKLVREDASVGIESSNMVEGAAALARRCEELFERYRQPVLAERFIDGREVNVTVLGNGEHLELLPLHEIDFGKMPAGRPHIVSYSAKWDENHEEYAGTLPVPMRDASPELVDRVGAVAKESFCALGLRDFGRVDLRIDRDGQPWVIDVNPNCDLSPGAGVARAARHAGMEFPQLIGRICEIAWRRHAGHSNDRTG
jgi:D-alanine-D-alanine ligase